MDPLLCKLEEEGSGFQHCAKNITAVAFANVLLLLSGSWEGMQTNVETLEVFCDLTGLRIQGGKSAMAFASSLQRTCIRSATVLHGCLMAHPSI